MGKPRHVNPTDFHLHTGFLSQADTYCVAPVTVFITYDGAPWHGVKTTKKKTEARKGQNHAFRALPKEASRARRQISCPSPSGQFSPVFSDLRPSSAQQSDDLNEHRS
jgi:hypothetical protein